MGKDGLGRRGLQGSNLGILGGKSGYCPNVFSSSMGRQKILTYPVERPTR